MTSLQKRRIFRGTDPRVAITKKFIEKSIDNFDVHVYHSLSAEQTTTNYTLLSINFFVIATQRFCKNFETILLFFTCFNSYKFFYYFGQDF